MSLDIGAALRDGLDRTVARSGVLLIGVFVVFGVVNAVIAQSLARAQTAQFRDVFGPEGAPGPGGPGGMPFPMESIPGMGQATPLGLPIPLPVAAALALVAAFVAEAIRIVGVRTLVSDETETIPDEFVRRNIGMATLNGVVGGIVVAVLTGIGFILLIVPGIFLALSFFFVRQEIAVEDKNFIDAMADSWSLTSGHRIPLFGLALIVVVIGLVASAVGAVFGIAGPAVGAVVQAVVSAITTVFGMAVAARAYVQLKEERETLDVESEESEFDFS